MPDQVADNLETHLIVQKIRCEAQSAVAAVFDGNARSPNIYRGSLAKFKVVSENDILIARERKKKFNKATETIQNTQEGRKKLSKTQRKQAELRADLALRERALKLETEKLVAYGNDLLREGEARKKRGEDAAKVDAEIEGRVKVRATVVAAYWRRFEATVRDFKGKVIRLERKIMLADRSVAKLESERKEKYGDILTYIGHQLTMQIKFSITETNSATAEASLKFPIPLGFLTIEPSGGDERERLGERTIKVAADFNDLLGEVEKQGDRRNCQLVKSVNDLAPRYPIVGDVGLAEAIEQYLQISEQAKNVFLKGAKAGSESYTHKIQFKTTVSAGIKPKIAITQVTGETYSGSLDLSGSRSDTHEVLLGVYDEKETDGSDADKITRVQVISDPPY